MKDTTRPVGFELRYNTIDVLSSSLSSATNSDYIASSFKVSLEVSAGELLRPANLSLDQYLAEQGMCVFLTFFLLPLRLWCLFCDVYV